MWMDAFDFPWSFVLSLEYLVLLSTLHFTRQREIWNHIFAWEFIVHNDEKPGENLRHVDPLEEVCFG